MNLQKLVAVSSLVILSACIMAPRPGGGVDIIPILPSVVELGDDSYYTQGGYHYFYTNEQWYYSPTRDGRRRELPRSHWPKETHYRNRNASHR